MSNPSTLKIAGILVAAGLCGFPVSGYAAYTQAGFEWVVPSDAPLIQGAPVTSAPLNTYSNPAPVSSAPEIISPVIIGGGVSSSVPSSSSSVTISSSNVNRQANPVIVNNAPPVTVGSPSMSSSMSSSMNAPMNDNSGSEVLSSAPPMATTGRVNHVAPVQEPSMASSTDVVQGFAKQVPLAVALRQLLPPGYGFSVDQNVDLGTLVSFQGGQAWRETLRTALEPVGLVVREQGQMVTIAHGDRNNLVMPSEASAPPSRPVSISSASARGLQNNMQTGVMDSITAPAAETGAGPIVQSWSAERGDTLHTILEEWSRRANVEFDWKSEYDYPLQASVAFSGTFEDAVRNLLTGFEGAHPQPIAELHANSNLGQMVLVVSTRGNNYSD